MARTTTSTYKSHTELINICKLVANPSRYNAKDQIFRAVMMMMMGRGGGHGKLMPVVALVLLGVTGAWSKSPQVPCFFIFGDSLVDNGNNNDILTLARANYMPYGIDFPAGVTGRFTNGRTVVDVLAQLLGFGDFIPAHAFAQGTDIMRGLNFASGASGIRPETGSNLGYHYPIEEQVGQFRSTVQTMTSMLGGNATRTGQYLAKCIYYMGLGSNDYLNNYFMPGFYPSSSIYTPSAFATLLLRDYAGNLSDMYRLGARKFVIVGLGQIGCIPFERARYNSSGSRRSGSQCNEDINAAIEIYNKGLMQMVNRFNTQLPDANFIYINSYEGFDDLVNNAATYGFAVADKGCCGVGRNNGQVTCLPFQTPCSDRSKYLFWDAFHPTEAANVLYAVKAYNSSSLTEVFPMNIEELAMA